MQRLIINKLFLTMGIMAIMVMPCKAESLSDAFDDISVGMNCLTKALNRTMTKTEACGCSFDSYKKRIVYLSSSYLSPGITHDQKRFIAYKIHDENNKILEECHGNNYVTSSVDKLNHGLVEKFKRDGIDYDEQD